MASDIFFVTSLFFYARLARDVDVVDLRFDDYGKEFIKSFRMSPDSYIQMALQVAYYRWVLASLLPRFSSFGV